MEKPKTTAEKDTQLADEILNRQTRLEAKRRLYEPDMRTCADYFCPNREESLVDTPGTSRGRKVYDGTPVSARKIWASGMEGNLLGRSIRWLNLKLTNDQLMENREVKLWLEEKVSRMVSALKRSNFYGQLNPLFTDGGWHGSPNMYSWENKKTGRLVFDVENPWNVWFELNDAGVADVIHRKIKLTAKQAIERFGIEDVSEKIRLAVEVEKKPYAEFEFVHAIYPNEDWDPAKIDNLSKKYAVLYVEKKTKKIVLQSGQNTLSPAVWLVRRLSGRKYGISPALDAMVEVLKGQQMSRTNTIAAHRLVEPAYNIPESMKDTVDLRPMGHNYYDDPQAVISAINSGIQLPAGIDREERVQKAIEKHFNVEFFTMLISSERQKTAYEIMQQQSEQAMLMGPQVGTFNDFLDILIERVDDLETEAGRMPPMPAVLEDYLQEEIEIEYVGPLAQAQKKMHKLQGIREGLEAAGPILEMSPSAADLIDFDATVDEVLDAAAFPERARRSDDDVAAIRQQREAVRQQQVAAEMVEQAAGAASKASKKIEPGSPLDMMAAEG